MNEPCGMHIQAVLPFYSEETFNCTVAEVFPYETSAQKRRYHMEVVREDFPGMASGRGPHTVEAVLTRPEGQRVELFDGEMAARAFPTATHQGIIGCLFTEIAVYLRAKEEHCRIMMSPFAVFLKDDGRNYLEPDITVVCDAERLDEEGCHGAPDWVIEVVSPTSRALDYGKKLGAYIDAGVREYWIVDSEKKVIVTYYLEQPDIPVIHHFGDIVKPSIYNDLAIDTSRLEDIQYRKPAKPRDRGHEDTVSSQISAVKKEQELKVAKEQLKQRPSEQEESMAQPQERGDIVAENATKTVNSVEEVKAYIKSHFSELLAAKNKGQIMKTAMGELKGKVDSRIVSEAVAELCQ